MSSTRNKRDKVLEIIASMTDTCAPVKLSIGSTFGNHYILIHEAPPSVVGRLVGECNLVSMTADGLSIPTEV